MGMYRAIVRFSINGENDNKTGLAVRKILEDEGFRHIGTGTFEIGGASFPDVADALTGALNTFKLMPGNGTVDHLWTYIDASA